MVELSERPDGTLGRAFGGDTLNTAVYLARLGVPTQYVTALGDDAFSDGMVAAWVAEGIDIACVARVPGRLPGLYMIRTDTMGERQFLYWRDSAPVRGLFRLPEIDAIGQAVRSASVLYLSGITLSLFDEAGQDALFALLAEARLAGAHVAFDINFRARGWPDRALARAVFGRALAHADLVFASTEDHALLYGAGNPDAVLAWVRDAGVAEAVVRLDIPACLVACGGMQTVVEARAVPGVLDTTAAGDSFAAGYIAAQRRGATPVEACHAGHRLAGVVVQHRGAIIPREAMPGMTRTKVP